MMYDQLPTVDTMSAKARQRKVTNGGTLVVSHVFSCTFDFEGMNL